MKSVMELIVLKATTYLDVKTKLLKEKTFPMYIKLTKPNPSYSIRVYGYKPYTAVSGLIIVMYIDYIITLHKNICN